MISCKENTLSVLLLPFHLAVTHGIAGTINFEQFGALVRTDCHCHRGVKSALLNDLRSTSLSMVSVGKISYRELVVAMTTPSGKRWYNEGKLKATGKSKGTNFGQCVFRLFFYVDRKEKTKSNCTFTFAFVYLFIIFF